MNLTKLIQTVVAVVVVVWLFSIGFVLGTRSIRKAASKPVQTPVTQYTAPTTQNPNMPSTSNWYATTLPSTAAPVSGGESTTAPVSEQAATGAATESTTAAPAVQTPATKKEIIDAYVNAVNKTKGLQNFSLTREDTLNLVLDDVTGGSVIKSIGNSLVSSKEPHTVETLVFQNGVDTNGSSETPMNAIPPITGYAALNEDGLLSASAQPNAYGGYTIDLALVDEMQTVETPAPNHSTSVEVIDLNSLGLPDNFTIISLDIYYSGCTIKAETDSEGKIVTMTHFLPVSHAEGTGKVSLITASVKLHGDFTCVYSFAY